MPSNQDDVRNLLLEIGNVWYFIFLSIAGYQINDPLKLLFLFQHLLKIPRTSNPHLFPPMGLESNPLLIHENSQSKLRWAWDLKGSSRTLLFGERKRSPSFVSLWGSTWYSWFCKFEEDIEFWHKALKSRVNESSLWSLLDRIM